MDQSEITPGQFWKHYKGDTYKILNIARHSETKEVLVVYERQTNFFHSGEWKIYARPIDMFFDEVEWEGEKVTRFTLVNE